MKSTSVVARSRVKARICGCRNGIKIEYGWTQSREASIRVTRDVAPVLLKLLLLDSDVERCRSFAIVGPQ
jgi:hypothetical protein